MFDDTVYDNIENEAVDSFSIIDRKLLQIDSFEDLRILLENQFSPEVEFPIDTTDYIQWFMYNIIKVPEDAFPHNCLEFINDDNCEDYDNFINLISHNFKMYLGITVSDGEYQLQNLYNLYYFFFVRPDELLVDILLGYHFHKSGYNFEDFYKHKIITNNIPTFDIIQNDPVQVVGSFNRQYFVENKNKEFITLSYKEKVSAFLLYLHAILNNPYEFRFIDIFNIANTYAPCDNYEDLYNQINVFYNIRFEEDEMIIDYFKKNIFHVVHRESYFTSKIINVFFKRIKDFESTLSSALAL